MNALSDDIQGIIYKYKHKFELNTVMNELKIIVECWCDDQLTFRYCKGRHIPHIMHLETNLNV